MNAHPALRLWIALTALVLVGCNLGLEPEIIYVTATPESIAQAPTPLPSATPAPTIPPTPTVPPEVALAVAGQALTNGRFEDAVGLYSAILTAEAAPPDMLATAALNMGRAALREGLFAESVGALTTLIERYPQHPAVTQAHFLRGDANAGLGEWAAALADYQFYLAQRPGLIDSYGYERIGDAQVALGQIDAALASYEQATSAGRSLVPLLALREKVAQMMLSAGQAQPALAQYEAILAVAQRDGYRALIEYLAATALIDNGARELGLDRMQTIFETYPNTPQAYEAMQALLEAGRPVDDYARGRVSFSYGDDEDTIEAFTRYTTAPSGPIEAELFLLLGRAYREIGSPDAAVVAFRTIIDRYPTDPLFGQALLEQGRTRFLTNDIPAAIERYLEIAQNYDYLPEAPEALWRAGYLYGTNGNPEASRQIFEQLADRYPDTEQARSGLFLAAAAAFNAGDPVGAERLYARLATTASGDDRAAAYLWVGRLAQARGDASIAGQAFDLAISASPDSYFAARATDLKNNRDSFLRPAEVTFQFDDAAQLAQAEAWLRERFSVTEEGALWPLSATLQGDVRLIRGNELWALGAYDAALVEFRELIDAYQSNGVASYQLAIFLRGIESYFASVLAGANVIRAAGVGTLEAPPYLARLRYPAYYHMLVEDAAERYDIDPLLMLSLIRHESLFNTYATAGAGEKGLTQVIPATGQYIAGELQWPDYQHADLFRPYAGIEFGAFFLAENLRRFDGNAQAALAGYNAGPGRAAQWLALSGGDPDQFMTAITIDSTRTYVERIYGFYAIYRALYGA